MISRSECEFEPDYYLRRYLSFGQSYAVPVRPYPDECLEDLLTRAACENGFAPMRSYRLLGLDARDKLAPGPNRYGITAKSLATLLGNQGGPAEVAHLLHDELSPSAHRSPFFDVWLDWRTLTNNRRVSPLALRSAPYLRAIWKVWPLSFDPETKETLLTRCPECENSLSNTFMGDIWCCNHCSRLSSDGILQAVDLREHPQALVPEEYWDALDFATSFIDPNKRIQRAMSRSELHRDFDGIDDGDIFETIFALARLMPGAPAKSARLEMSAPDMAAAAELVRGWPATFEGFMSDFARRMPRSHHALRAVLYNTRLSAAVRDRMKELVRAASVQSAMRDVGDRRFNQELIALAEFRSLRKWIKGRAFEVKSDVNCDALLLRSRNDMREFTEKLGIPIPSLIAMADDGVLPWSVLREHSRLEFPERANEFVDRLRANACRTEMPKSAVRLPRAVGALFARVGDPWSIVFQAMLAGGITYWSSPTCARFSLERLFIDDLESLALTLAKSKPRSRSLVLAEMSRREAGIISRLQETGFSAATKAGLVHTPINWVSLARFRAEFEPSNLLSVRYKLGKRKEMTRGMHASLESAGIRPVALQYNGSLTLWRRDEVERHFGPDLIPCVR